MAGVETVQMFENLEKHILRRVARVLGVTQNTQSDVVNRLLVAQDQYRKRLAVARAALQYQFCILIRHREVPVQS